MEVISLIKEKVGVAVSASFNIGAAEIHVEQPKNEKWGDFSTNVAMQLAKQLEKTPFEVATILVNLLTSTPLEVDLDGTKYGVFEKIEAAPSGFINFTISQEVYLHNLSQILIQQSNYGGGSAYKDKKIVVEYTDPNPFKIIHIGHLMNNCIGEALTRLFEFQGAILKRANYQGDVGMHVAKSVWGMLKEMDTTNTGLDVLEAKPVKDRVAFLGKCYASGATAYEEDKDAAQEMQAINYLVFISAQEFLKESEKWEPQIDYKQHLKSTEGLDYSKIKLLYEKGRQWSLEYFETVYKRLGTKFDFYYFESIVGEKGYKVVKEFLEKGLFEESDGAIIFNGEKYGLHTRVFVNSLGLPTYEAKELGLSASKYSDFPYDLSFVVTANEINAYFKVLLKAMSFTNPELAEKTTHISHGVMKLESGKMSSRTGKIKAGDDLLDQVKEIVFQRMKDGSDTSLDKATVADQVAVASIKYDVLKHSIGKDIIYNEETSLALTGDTGPYLQYTHARANSLLSKASTIPTHINLGLKPDEKEIRLIKLLYQFPEITRNAALEISPNILCAYLFDLAQQFNFFYNDVPVLNTQDPAVREFRLSLVLAVKIVLKTGLHLLGIQTPNKL